MSDRDAYRSKVGIIVDTILNQTSMTLQDRHGIRPSGKGAAMPEGVISELVLAFDTKDTLTKTALRKLLLECAQELVNAVNSNPNIQPFLEESPFTVKNVQIIIYNHDKDGRELYDPEISTAQISEGILTYRTTDPVDDFKFKHNFEESYEEALRALSE